MLRSSIFSSLSFILILNSCSSEKKEAGIYTEFQLGEALFHEKILSRDSSISCASCHRPDHAFADLTPTSKGVYGRMGNRNTPSAMNMGDRNLYFWDGRAETLEDQALGPIENPVEMDLPLSIAIRRLLNSEKYSRAFMHVYGKIPSRELLAQAISTFERTLETSKSPFDLYMSGEDTSLFSESAKRGLDIFNNKGKCFDCHFGTDFTGNDQFRSLGLYNGKDLNDKGRYEVTKNEKDLGRFKVPGLRNIAMTAPYMHNGMHKTLMEVINYYNEPDKFIANSINRDSLLNKPLGLTLEEKKDLEAFLISLTDQRFKSQESRAKTE
jgi:cytochrome c peroxidase